MYQAACLVLNPSVETAYNVMLEVNIYISICSSFVLQSKVWLFLFLGLEGGRPRSRCGGLRHQVLRRRRRQGSLRQVRPPAGAAPAGGALLPVGVGAGGVARDRVPSAALRAAAAAAAAAVAGGQDAPAAVRLAVRVGKDTAADTGQRGGGCRPAASIK